MRCEFGTSPPGGGGGARLTRYPDRPVVDLTGPTGKYAFVLDWPLEPAPGLPEAQLGLRLETGTSPPTFW